MPSEAFEFAKTYYWRVDEVQTDLLTTHKGTVWSFTIGPEPPHLRDLATDNQIWIGSAVSSNELLERPYRDTLKREFNLLTPGNDMKWGPIHPQRNQYNFDPADAIVDFAESNGMDVHGHTLIWHNQNPNWLTDGNFTRFEMIDILHDHIHTVVDRYAGRIAVWDVVNEVVTSRGLRETLWMNKIGPEYIDLAFQFAHEADPNAILIINDFSVEPVNSKSTILYNLVRDLQRRGVPIHGVGFQMHLALKWALDYQSFANNMRRFAELGLQIYITEMDVRIQEPVTEADLTRQATIYDNVIAKCLEESACVGFQTWGFTDKHSWITGHFEGYNDALIFDRSYLPKPAYYSLRQKLLLNVSPDPTLPYVEAFENGDFSSFDWESFGDSDWFITSSESNSGTYGAQAGPIADNGSTTLKLTLECTSGQISFFYKASSEQHYDYLRFYIDGTQQDEWSGNEDWTQVSFAVSPGRRTFKWVYSKDGSSYSGSDTAWIDDIVFPVE
jgi:endo-1,4-beta-xylanase